MALGVGVAIATGGSGLAWADAGSTGDSQSAGTSAGQGGDGDSAAPSPDSGSADDAETGGDGGDDDAPEADAPDGDEPRTRFGSSGSVDTSVNDAGQSTDTTVLTDEEEGDESDLGDELESDADDEDEGDGEESTSGTTEPAVSQRDSGPQSGVLDESDEDSGRIDDVAAVVEDVVERDADDVTEQQAPPESLTSQVVLAVENFVDERQVSTTVVSEEPEAAPTSTEVPDTIVRAASTVVAALLSPFLAPSPVAPAEPPLAWALLAFVRREWQHMLLNRTPQPVVDTVTTSEDTPITVDVVTGTDPDAVAGDVVTVTEVTQPQNGTVTLQGGTLTYAPNSDFHGTDTFTYTISDEESPLHIHGLKGLWAAIFGGDAGHATTVTVSVTVTPVNDAPVAVDDAVTVDEDSGANVIDVLGNDTDSDGDQLAVTEVGAAFNGIVTLTDGVITYTPDTDFSGTDLFTYTISDGNGGTATATVAVTVAAVQDAPAPQDDAYTTEEDTPLTIPAPGVLDNDIDVDGDDLSAHLINSPAHGSIELNGDGSFTYTPFENFHGLDSFTYGASDGNGGTATATVYVRVTPVNDAPVAGDDDVVTDEDTPVVIDVLGNDSDVDGDTLAVTAAGAAGNGMVTVSSGVVTYTPDADFHGADSFTYTITDGNGETASATVHVTVNSVNDAPVAFDDIVAVDEDSVAVVDVLANDSDVDGDELSVTAAGAAGNGMVTLIDGVITYTPDADFHGADSFTYTVSDGNGGTASATVYVTVNSVNDAPVANDDEVSTNENTPIVIDVLGNDYDADTEDELAVSLLRPPTHGVAVLNDDGTITYTPDADYRGIDTFTYGLYDGTDTSSIARVTITVHQAPLVANDDDVVTDEDTPVLIDFLANDSDPTGDTITGITIEYDGDGAIDLRDPERFTITYIPRPDFFGTDTITYYLRDADGRASDVATVTITVNPVNDDPEASDDIVTVRANSGATVVNVLGNDTDVDGDDLLVTDVGTANNGTVDLSGGVITYTPSADFVGSDSFTYTVSDGNDGIATATVHVWVDNPPVANDDFASTEEGIPVVIDVLGNDFNPTGGEHLSVRIIGQPHMGTAELNDDGTITYTPTADYRGSDQIRYEISVDTGVGASAVVHIDVRERTLVANDIAADTDENNPGLIRISVIDTRPDGETDITIRVDNSENGVVRLVEQREQQFTLEYTPRPHFIGTDSFTYQLVGADGRVSHPYTVTITVDPVTGGPRAIDDTVVVDANSDTVEIDVLANDFEVNDQELAVVQVSEARNGTVMVNDGVITYRPNSGFDGVDSFTYTVANGVGAAATATVAVTVEDADPITFDDAAQLSEAFFPDFTHRIYVLADDELRIVDPVTREWLSTVELGATPSSVAVSPRGDYAYVATKDATDVSAVSKVDLRSGTSTPVGEVGEATAMALDRYGDTLYVADYRDATVKMIDRATGEQQILDIGLRSNAIAASEYTETLYVGSINNEVWAVDVETGSKEVVYSGAWDETTVADPSITVAGDFAYVADGLNNRVAVINTFTNETYAVYDVWATPTSVAATPYSEVFLVASAAENKVTVISLELGVLGEFAVGDDFVDIDFADVQQPEVYVTKREGISRVPAENINALFRTDPR
ncbi:Ig-like domain-containing protein [Mycolicibacterium sp. XJ2546]